LRGLTAQALGQAERLMAKSWSELGARLARQEGSFASDRIDRRTVKRRVRKRDAWRAQDSIAESSSP